jgi:hypothetical protein
MEYPKNFIQSGYDIILMDISTVYFLGSTANLVERNKFGA